MKGSAARQKPVNWPRIERKPDDSPLPYLDFDVDFFLADGRVTIARLNEFAAPLNISPREFALTLLFDGTTTVREAELVAVGARRGKSQSSVIDRLLSQMAGAGFSVSLNGRKSIDGGKGKASSKRAGKKRS